MKLKELVRKTDAVLLTDADGARAEIERVYAGDRVSDMLAHTTSTTLVVTNLTGHQLLRIAELMDIPAVCLLNGVQPDSAMKSAADERHIAIIVSPADMFETCGRLHRALRP